MKVVEEMIDLGRTSNIATLERNFVRRAQDGVLTQDRGMAAPKEADQYLLPSNCRSSRGRQQFCRGWMYTSSGVRRYIARRWLSSLFGP